MSPFRQPDEWANRSPARRPEIRGSSAGGQQAREPVARRSRALGRTGGDRRDAADPQSQLGDPLLHRGARPVRGDRLGPAQGRQGRRLPARTFPDVLRPGAADLPRRGAQSLEHRELAGRNAIPLRHLHVLLCTAGHRDAHLFLANDRRDGHLGDRAVGGRRRLVLDATQYPRARCPNGCVPPSAPTTGCSR